MSPQHLLTQTILTCCCFCGSVAALPLSSRRTSFKKLVSSSSTSKRNGLLHEICGIRDGERETDNSFRGLFLRSADAAAEDWNSQIENEKNHKYLQSCLQREVTNDFDLLIQMAIQTLIRSDLDGEELDHSYGSASQGLWIHAPSAKKVQQLLNCLALKVRSKLVYADIHA